MADRPTPDHPPTDANVDLTPQPHVDAGSSPHGEHDPVTDRDRSELDADHRGDGLDRIHLFGLPLVDAPSLEPVMAQMLDGAPPPEGLEPLVLTPNVDIVVHLTNNEDRVEADLFRRAQYCLPDGAPIVGASRLLGRPLGARLAGSDLFAMLWPQLVERQVPVVVVASSDEIATALDADGPQAEFIVPPMFDGDDPAQVGAVADQVLEASRRIKPRLVLVGVGNPKDARVIGALLDRWDLGIGPVPLSMGLGASFALHLGLQKRAPRWVQRIGMEWFHRFAQEPRRLFRRYFVDDVAFIPIVWREWRRGTPTTGHKGSAA